MNDPTPKTETRGRKSVFSAALGSTKNIGHRLPEPVHELLYDPAVKRLLNSMACDPEFKKAILELAAEN